MMRLGLIGVGAVAVCAALYGFYYASFTAGKNAGIAEQAAADRKAYARVLEKINDQTIDPADDAAVLRELCRLAGASSSNPQCSGL